LLQDRSGEAKKTTSAFRCPNATTRSLEDSHANGLLQLTNAAAQCRLPNNQGFRGSPKTAVIRSCHRIAEVLKVDCRYSALKARALELSFIDHAAILGALHVAEMRDGSWVIAATTAATN
jgi:hypothetical protein